MSAFPSTYTGTYTGTGAAVMVTLGFKPKAIQIFNVTDGDAAWFWTDTMAADTAIASAAAVASLASNGVTVSDNGFTAGTGLSESAKVFHYAASR